MSSYQHLEEKDYIEVIPFHGKHNDASSCHSGKSRSNKDNTPITNTQSGSDTEREPSNMSSRTSRHSSGSISRKEKIAASKTKKTDDWTEVTEPDERRRIQNRIAQRKFREKAREQKDRAARDAQNQQHAGSSYHIPDPEDFTLEDGGDLSGLPWGGLSMRHVVTRGHASASTGHHTHSHHSGNTGGSSSIIHQATTTPGPVDQALYHMTPYGYTAPPPHQAHATMVDATGEVYHGYESPYTTGYYAFDPAGADPTHGL